MTLITVDGVYENGKVELAKRPEGVERARVRVTFLTEASGNRKKPGGKARASQVRGEIMPVTENHRYPQALKDEYAVLIHKKLHRTITNEEHDRLEAVRAEINQRDRQSDSWSAWEQCAAKTDAEFADLRRELESLPDA